MPEEVRRAADLLERRWVVSVLWASYEGATRFNEFKQAVGAIPPGTLAQRLVELEEAGVLEGIEVVADPYDACDGAQLLLVLTEWDEFRWLDIEAVGGRLAERRILDGRNLLDREALLRHGFAYRGIGRA